MHDNPSTAVEWRRSNEDSAAFARRPAHRPPNIDANRKLSRPVRRQLLFRVSPFFHVSLWFLPRRSFVMVLATPSPPFFFSSSPFVSFCLRRDRCSPSYTALPFDTWSRRKTEIAARKIAPSRANLRLDSWDLLASFFDVFIYCKASLTTLLPARLSAA